ncbi:MAG: hypothetical protein ACYTAN_16290 [Planctomycetota bacterium]
MKKVQIAAISVLIILASATCRSTFSAQKAIDSPTGRRPKLHWTPERQAVWNRMVAEEHPWWQRLKSWADATNTPAQRYADLGQYATLAYQWTGETKYARAAWLRIQPVIDTMRPAWNNRNGTREEFIRWVWMYDWLYPALTAEERALFLKYLNTLADLVLNRVEDVSWGTRTGDSDETTGHYFGLAFMDLATGPDNPRAGSLLSATFGAENKPVGGLDSTGANFDTMRNAIAFYVSRAKGGAWVESSEYNTGTLKLLFIGAEGVRTATGVDHFPEVTALLGEAGIEQIHELCPGFIENGQSFKWGDCEHPRNPKTQGVVALLGLLAGLNQDNKTVGPYLHRLTEDIVAGPIPHADKPWGRFFLFYNPYADKADWRSLPRGYYVEGQGLLYLRDGWDDKASALMAHMPNRVLVDHEVNYLGDFQLFRKGEWAVTHPIAYAGNEGERMNSMLIAGLSSSAEVRRALAHEFGPEFEYAYLAGVTGGQHYRNRYWSPPPTFLHEWTRSMLYLPGAEGGTDVIIVYDRTNADDPKTLERWPDRYYPNQRGRIEAACARKQWIIHMPVEPRMTQKAIEWKTPGGQNVRLEALLPADSVKQAFDENDVGVPGYIHDYEKKWQVRIWPAEDRRWDTFLNVVSVSDEGANTSARLVKSADDRVEGVLVARAGAPEVLAVFNAAPGPELPQPDPSVRENWLPAVPEILETVRLRKSNYALQWTAGGKSTEVFLCDLDPAMEWEASLDGSPRARLEVSVQGLARLKCEGEGDHTLEVAPR